jgi:Flp pilus assembly protein TadD
VADSTEAGDALKYFQEGNAHFERGELDAAIQDYRRGLDAAPHHAALHYNLGNALLRRGRPVEAIDSFLACLQARPDFALAYVNLAETLRSLGLLDQALWAAQTAQQLLPDQPEAHIVLASTLHDRSEYEAAELEYRRALDIVPHHPGVLSSLGNTLHAMGRLAEALSLHDRAIAAAPEDPDFHYNRAATRLAAGDYARGWSDYEWRLLREQARCELGPAWRGEDIAGTTILLHAEQGLGDTLQFVRYAPLVAARGMRVVLEVQPPLVTLMRSLPGPEKVIGFGDSRPPFDAHCSLLSLPHVLKTTLQTVPAHVPYLHADPSAIQVWAGRLPEDAGLRVGIVWAGSSHREDAGAHLIDQRRSTTREAFAALADVPGIHLVSLQKPERSETPAPLANYPD